MIVGHVPHAVLLVGPAAVGKTTLALDLAAGLLCTAPDPAARPCRACRACRLVAGGNHPDVHRLAPEGAGGQVVIGDPRDTKAPRGVRDVLHELAFLPVEGGARVAVVEGAEADERGRPERAPQDARGAGAGGRRSSCAPIARSSSCRPSARAARGSGSVRRAARDRGAARRSRPGRRLDRRAPRAPRRGPTRDRPDLRPSARGGRDPRRDRTDAARPAPKRTIRSVGGRAGSPGAGARPGGRARGSDAVGRGPCRRPGGARPRRPRRRPRTTGGGRRSGPPRAGRASAGRSPARGDLAGCRPGPGALRSGRAAGDPRCRAARGARDGRPRSAGRGRRRRSSSGSTRSPRASPAT